MIKVGIIGCGLVCKVHIDAILKLQNAKIVAVCDTDPAKARDAAARTSAAQYVDAASMFDEVDLDVVHICTPHHLHAEMILSALERQIHVFCEKPVILDLTQVETIRAAILKSGAKVGVCFQNRLNPTSIAMKEIVETERYGKLLGLKGIVTWTRPASYYAQSPWRGSKATEGGGLLINQAIHTIDLLQWLGGPLASISGSAANHSLADVIEVEDTSEIYLKFASGAIGLFYGTNGFVENTPVEMHLRFENASVRYLNAKLYLEADGEFELISRDFESDTPEKNYWGTSHASAIESFYGALDTGAAYISFEDGLPALQILEKVYSSTQKRA